MAQGCNAATALLCTAPPESCTRSKRGRRLERAAGDIRGRIVTACTSRACNRLTSLDSLGQKGNLGMMASAAKADVPRNFYRCSLPFKAKRLGEGVGCKFPGMIDIYISILYLNISIFYI